MTDQWENIISNYTGRMYSTRDWIDMVRNTGITAEAPFDNYVDFRHVVEPNTNYTTYTNTIDLRYYGNWGNDICTGETITEHWGKAVAKCVEAPIDEPLAEGDNELIDDFLNSYQAN